MDNERIEYNIPTVPSFIFQYDNKVKEILNENTVTHLIDHISYDNGIEVFKVGAAYAEKGFPFPEAIADINIVKRILIESLKVITKPIFIPSAIIFLVLPFKRKIKLIEDILVSFNRLSMGCIKSRLLKHQYLTPCANELYILIKSFLVKLGIDEEVSKQFAEIFAHIIQYDNAYRFRLQDILSETNKTYICLNPKGEIKRLLKLLKERDSQVVGKKFQMFSYLFMLLLSVKRIKKVFYEVISNSKYEKLQLDASDRYWVSMRGDYNYMGLTLEARLNLLEIANLKKPQAFLIQYE